VSEDLVDESVTRLLLARLKLGIFDPANKQAYNEIPLTVVDSEEHRKTARHAARASLVLLKNSELVLPLNPRHVHSVLVTGPHANTTVELCSNYIGELPEVVSILEGLRRSLRETNITYERGCGMASFNLSETIQAETAAKVVQYSIVALGLDQTQETEVGPKPIYSTVS
jgi:beta-glucosidase